MVKKESHFPKTAENQRRSGPRRAAPWQYKKTKHTPAEGLWLYGMHPVRAALANPDRKCKKLILTEKAKAELGEALIGSVPCEIADMEAIAKILPQSSVHQGVALSCDPLPQRDIETLLDGKEGRRLVLMLDQITDPHNFGAILRTAAAFSVDAVIVQDRNSPPETGVLAKSASGALDTVPVVRVVNLSRELDTLGKMGFWRLAMAGDGEVELKDSLSSKDICVVLGSEGSGIRRLVREHCDESVSIAISDAMESLNVSNAAAIAMYEARRALSQED